MWWAGKEASFRQRNTVRKLDRGQKCVAAAAKMGRGQADGRFAVLVAFLCKLVFFPHHQPHFFSLSLSVLPFPPPYFPLQCPFSCCLLFPVGSSWLRLTLPCQSSSWKQHSSAAFTPLFRVLCVTPLSLVLLLQGFSIFLGQWLLGALFTQSRVQLGPCTFWFYFSCSPNKCD